jgi:hypothetical protein
LQIVAKLQLFKTHFNRIHKLCCEGKDTMPEHKTDSLAQVQQEQKMKERVAKKQIAAFSLIGIAAQLAIVGVMLHAQDQAKDKYSLISPDGIAFSNFRDTRTGQWSLPPAPKKCLR